MFVKSRTRGLLFCALTLFASASLADATRAQDAARSQSAARTENEEVVRVNTRVVFLDALVRDERTGAPVRDLAREDFEVRADGRARELAYFSREGDARRRPLALVLMLDLSRSTAGRFLRRPEVVESLIAALARLAPEDEVALLASSFGGFGGKPEMLVSLTRDRAQVAAALALAPTLTATMVGSPAMQHSQTIRDDITLPAQILFNEEHEEMVREVARLATVERPDSQVALVRITADAEPMPFAQREEIVARLLRANVTYHALVTDLGFGFRLLSMAGNGALRAASVEAGFSGHVQPLARETGGQVVRVRRPEDYGAGLEQIINGFAARYSLGFALNENERADERLRPLEVRVSARDARGRERRVTVSARRGYYLPQM